MHGKLLYQFYLTCVSVSTMYIVEEDVKLSNSVLTLLSNNGICEFYFQG